MDILAALSGRPMLKTHHFPMTPLDSLLAEVALLRQEVATLRQSRKSPCEGVTGKGTPCRNGALPGTSHCRMHSREPKEVRVPKPRKEPKPKKTIPEHSHPLGSVDPTCALCNTHGDCMDPSLPDHDFEGPDDITERLRELLSREEV
jgi:hypothetical protein